MPAHPLCCRRYTALITAGQGSGWYRSKQMTGYPCCIASHL